MIICIITVCPFVFEFVPMGEIPRNPLNRRVGFGEKINLLPDRDQPICYSVH
jgi:hypothetical protein